MISHLLLTVLTNFSRNVSLNVLSRATVGYLLFFALEQLAGSLQRRKMRIYDSLIFVCLHYRMFYPLAARNESPPITLHCLPILWLESCVLRYRKRGQATARLS
jgi:hypothetical protein